jgi:hypothetical protein
MRKRSGWGIILSLTVAASFTAPSTVAAQESLAATCPGPAAFIGNGTPDERFAQTFVPTATGSLTRAEFDWNEPAGHQLPFVVQILAADNTGAPTDTVLAETSVADVFPGPTTLVALFATPTTVTAGQTYYLAISRPGAGDGALAWGYRSESDACPGQFYYQPGGTGPWSADEGIDATFSVFVTPLPPEPDEKANRNLTLDANKNKVKKGKKVLLSGLISSAARQGPCESSQTVELQRKRPKQTTYTTFAQVQTDAQGSFSLKKKLKKTFEFRAQVVETAACTAALSNSEKVKVKNKRR